MSTWLLDYNVEFELVSIWLMILLYIDIKLTVVSFLNVSISFLNIEVISLYWSLIDYYVSSVNVLLSYYIGYDVLGVYDESMSVSVAFKFCYWLSKFDFNKLLLTGFYSWFGYLYSKEDVD